MGDWKRTETLFLLALLLAFAWYSCGNSVVLEASPLPPFVIDNAAAD